MNPQSVSPKHIALIMDGNGRWAQSRGFPRLEGHRRGAETVRHLVQYAPALGIECLTFYAFSSENWKRPEDEVSGLMRLIKTYFSKELDKIAKENVRIRIFGDLNPEGKLGTEIVNILRNSEEKTKEKTGLQVNFCINYGGRDDLVRATRALAKKVQLGTLDADDISEDMVSRHLDSTGLPDPELVIRTGGDHRLSNFLLWQASYSELIFTETLWPDFTVERLEEFIHQYAGIDRRFGGLK